MNKGRSLSSIAAELERQAEARKDYIAPQARMRAIVDTTGEVLLDGVNGAPMPIQAHAHAQGR